ncbi:hypothetical protein [Actinomadura opuntiae]|uniref:hypothetical protein n=1 Tax=Actinomadura sp. OS1-43 TaxID=604315 RepID=UPI00255AC881|nr:hypothetical protein [Actinomadura sp. OS1-43]MDL4816626.1 hypothetical protein [Actinomadura sp. OS1-43]
MNRPHAARTPAPASVPASVPHCPRGRRKPASAALTTLLATAAALVATTQPPAGAATPSPAPSSSHPPLAPGRPPAPPPDDEAQLRKPSPTESPATQPADPRDVLPGTLAGLAPSAASTGVGGVLPPLDGPAPAASPAPPSSPAPQTGPEDETGPPETPRDEPVPDAAEGVVSSVLTAVLPDLPDLPKSVRLRQEFATGLLRASGIGWRSTGNCSDRNRTTCTSFDGLRWGTLKGLLDFRAASGCPITVTGGTERGHSGGPRSHAAGYKLDIATGRCVDAAIRRYPYQGVRGDGARLYRSPDGTLFAREKDHWDITFP